ncbi:MAG: tetratricopeptide repeat protein [Myxococcales bacterium]|nr:tetratricopeptide repeat protein [Myxococcales bacterium]
MKRRPGTDDATRVRMTTGDDELAAALLGRLDDHAGPARRLPQARAQAMVSAIVDAALTGVDGADASSPGATTAARPSRRLAPLLAVALLLAAVAGAAAAVVTTRYLSAPPAAPPPTAPGPSAPGPAAADRVAPAADDDAASADGAAADDDRAPPRPRPRPERSARPAAAPAPAPELPADAPAEDVLALANQRRKQRAWREADALYRRVVRAYPRTEAAVVAEVASATIRLEHLGDPAGALAGFRRALKARPAGALGEEARWGIAEAFRGVGDARGEAFALRVFLETHPGSAMAPAARKRLAELPP